MSYAIQNLDTDHLGFLLFSNDEASGDCIFRSLPNKSEVFESVESQVLLELQECGEFQYFVKGQIIEISHYKFDKTIIIENNRLSVGDNQFKLLKLDSD